MKKNKPYKLGLIAKEVQRLNMVEGTYPENHKIGSPSFGEIQGRVKKLYAK